MWDKTTAGRAGAAVGAGLAQRRHRDPRVRNSGDNFISQGWSRGPSQPAVAGFNSRFGSRGLRCRSTPTGAASFDVHATPAVTVHMIHSPATKPTADSRWPLDPDIEVVVTIDVTSRTVDDNQVSCSSCAQNGEKQRNFLGIREDVSLMLTPGWVFTLKSRAELCNWH